MKPKNLSVLTDDPQPWDYGATVGGPPPGFKIPEKLQKRLNEELKKL